MRYLVTGGAGFVGSHVVDRLLADGSCVRVYDNLSSGKRSHFAQHLDNKDFEFVLGDVLKLDAVCAAMQGCDFVCHLASNPDIAKSMIETDLDLRLGTIASFNVIEAMRRVGVKNIFFTSGSGIYGDTGEREVFEDMGPLEPISMYGASKLASEGMISAYSHLHGIRAFIFRIANIIGPRQTHGVAYDFIAKLRKDPKHLDIWGDGTQSKSYIHATDLTAAMAHVIANAKERYNVFNVATHDYLDVTAIAKMVVTAMGLGGVEFRYSGGKRGWAGDVPVVRFDIKRVLALGWKPKYGSEEAMRSSIAAMLKEPVSSSA
ncbi:MAG: NAD-dependent epimerase/dehydratase family protein [Elusimicrobiota bacterium]